MNLIENPTLDSLINATLEQRQRAEAEQEAALARQEAVERQAAIDEINGMMRAELGDVYEMINGGMEVSATKQNGGYNVVTTFHDGDVRWTISAKMPRRSGPLWYVEARCPGVMSMDLYVDEQKLRAQLLLAMGTMREEVKEMAAHYERKRQEQEAALLERQQQAEAAAEEDRRLSAMIAEKITAARATVWYWTEGVEITFYKMRWCTGGSHSYEDDQHFDYEEGYTTTDQIGADGYITVYPTYCTGKARSLRLNPLVHRPTWERLTASKVEDVPHRLRYEETIRIEGVGYSDGLLVERDYDSVSPAIAELPAAWIRNLVDSAPVAVIVDAEQRVQVVTREMVARWGETLTADMLNTGELRWMTPDYVAEQWLLAGDELVLYRQYIEEYPQP